MPERNQVMTDQAPTEQEMRDLLAKQNQHDKPDADPTTKED